MDRRVVVVCGALAGAGLVVGGMLIRRKWRQAKVENRYETALMVDQYLSFHYAPPSEYVEYPAAPKDAFEFPSRCATLCKRHKSVSVDTCKKIMRIITGLIILFIVLIVFVCFVVALKKSNGSVLGG